MEKKPIREIISVIFKAVTLAMGVAVVVLSCREHHHNSRRKKLTRCEKMAQKEWRKAERQERKPR